MTNLANPSGLVPERKKIQKLILSGRNMTCPRCKVEQELLHFIPLKKIEEYDESTMTIYKCPLCRWLFAPA